MSIIDRLFRDRDAQWERVHRWDRLGQYNSEVARGIVHTPEYDEEMEREQRLFNQEHGYPHLEDWPEGVIGRNQYGWISK